MKNIKPEDHKNQSPNEYDGICGNCDCVDDGMFRYGYCLSCFREIYGETEEKDEEEEYYRFNGYDE